MSIYVTKVELPDNVYVDKKHFQKMIFISNAIENGWHVRKRKNSYFFSKKHKGRREIFMEEYLETFIETHSSIDNELS